MLLLDQLKQYLNIPRLVQYFGLILAGMIISTPAIAQKLVVEELWRTNGDPATTLFTSVSGAAEAADGSIWVSDGRVNQVLALDSTLAVRIVAREGDGPGEVSGPTHIARTPAGGLAIYALGRHSIEVFGPDGKFERRVALRVGIWNAKGFAVLPDGDFILSGGIPGGAYVRGGDIPEGQFAIHRFSQKGELVHSWWPIRNTRDPHAGVMVAGGSVAILCDGSILYSDASPHQIFRFSANGSERRLLASDPELLEPIGDEFIKVTSSGGSLVTNYEWHFPQSRLVAQLSSGHILNVVQFLDDNRTLFQLYTSAGVPLAETWVDTAYRTYSLTSNGDLLADWMDPETHERYLVRLKIEYRP